MLITILRLLYQYHGTEQISKYNNDIGSYDFCYSKRQVQILNLKKLERVLWCWTGTNSIENRYRCISRY